MPSALDGTMLLLVSAVYLGLVASLNMLEGVKFLLFLPVPVFLAIFLVYAVQHKS